MPTTPILQAMSTLAAAENVTVVFTLVTQEGTPPQMHQTVVAIDETGKVIALHYKFQLHSTEAQLVPGNSVATSCFDTPAGKVCMIDGADVQCVVTGMTTNTFCTTHAISMLTALQAQQPRIVAFTNWWTASGAGNPVWQVLNVNKKLATDWNVWLV